MSHRRGGMGSPAPWTPPRRHRTNSAQLGEGTAYGSDVRLYPDGERPLVSVRVSWDDGTSTELTGVLLAWCGAGETTAVLFEGQGVYGWFDRADVTRT